MKLTHPHSGQTIEAEASDADTFRSQGWVEGDLERPAGNASTDAWRTYARDVGYDGDVDAMGRDDLIAALS